MKTKTNTHKKKQKINRHTHTKKNTENQLVYNNTMGWLRDGSHRGQVTISMQYEHIYVTSAKYWM